MATYCKYTYEKVTLNQLEKATKWCQNQLNLRDWEINLEYGDTIPDWVNDSKNGIAYINANTPYFFAKIWISSKRCLKNQAHPISSLCHEMIHVLFYNYNLDNHDERLIITLQNHLFQSWLAQHKKRKRK